MKDSSRWTGPDCMLLDNVERLVHLQERGLDLDGFAREEITMSDIEERLRRHGVDPLRIVVGHGRYEGVLVSSISLTIYRRGACEVVGCNLTAALVAMIAEVAGGEEFVATATALHIQGLVSEVRWT